jgi:hypothetical protein
MNSSRLHKRCGTSFMFLVMFISIIFFIFIRVDNTGLQVLIRLLLIPVIAGVSYEVLRAAGKNDENKFLDIVSRPGLWMQKLTTKEPDRRMVEVAIRAVEAVFDWREFVTEYNKNDENFAIEESNPEDFVTDEEKAEAAIKRQEAYQEVLEQQESAARKAKYDAMAEAAEDDSDDDIFTFEDANGRKIDRADVGEEDDDSEDADSDDGIEFDEDTSGDAENEELYADDVPVFKQRKTDK